MNTYTVRYEETSVMYKDITAASEVAAMKEFESMIDRGEIDIAAEMQVIKSVTTTV